MARKWTYGEAYMTSPVRLKFVNLHAPSAFQGGRETYNARVLVPKTNKEELAELQRLIEDVSGKNIDSLAKHPFLDGEDEWRDGDAEHLAPYPEYRGTFFFGFASADPIDCYLATDEVLEEHGEPMQLTRPQDIQRELYDGCWATLLIRPGCWIDKSIKGGDLVKVTFFCNAVFKVKDDKKLAGGGLGMDATQMFLSKLGKTGNTVLGRKPAKGLVARAAEVSEVSEQVDEVPVKRRGRPSQPAKANGAAAEEKQTDALPPTKAKRKGSITSLLSD